MMLNDGRVSSASTAYQEDAIFSSNVKPDKAYSILPSKIYTVVGLESSGTPFVATLIRDALNQTEFREGDFPYVNPKNNELDVQVHHFSLPFGSTCHEMGNVPVLDVVVPPQCSRKSLTEPNIEDVTFKEYKECGQLAHAIWNVSTSNNLVTHPHRYMLDIVSQKEWYEAHGTEQNIIIVLRDEDVSRKARQREHCKDPLKLSKEEAIGRGIIEDAINKYIDQSTSKEKQVTREKVDFWSYDGETLDVSNGEENEIHDQVTNVDFQEKMRRKLSLKDSSSASIPNKNNVFIVSYESLMMLKETYATMLFNTLDMKPPKDLSTYFSHTAKPKKAYSILPDKIYSVIGLEGSGAKYVSSVIRDALNQTEYREGDFPYVNQENNELDVQVQHFSLPQGGTCDETRSTEVDILDVVMPPQCSRARKGKMFATETIHKEYGECGQMAHEIWNVPNTTNIITHPKRYLLDIVSQKEWYDAHGVEQYFIIVTRDRYISRVSKLRRHCKNFSQLRKEEEMGRKIIEDAINKYIVWSDTKGKMVTRENSRFWRYDLDNDELNHDKIELNDKNETQYTNSTSSRRKLSLNDSVSVSIKNNVVLISYESLVLLRETYVRMLLEALDIQTPPDFKVSNIINGNKKYLNN